MTEKRFTGELDKHNNKIFEGMKLKGKNFDGEEAVFTVVWSDLHGNFIGTNRNEMYDVALSGFNKYEIVD